MGFTWTKEQKTTPKAQMKIGELIVQAKVVAYNDCGLSAHEISEKLGITESTVRRWINHLNSNK